MSTYVRRFPLPLTRQTWHVFSVCGVVLCAPKRRRAAHCGRLAEAGARAACRGANVAHGGLRAVQVMALPVRCGSACVHALATTVANPAPSLLWPTMMGNGTTTYRSMCRQRVPRIPGYQCVVALHISCCKWPCPLRQVPHKPVLSARVRFLGDPADPGAAREGGGVSCQSIGRTHRCLCLSCSFELGA